MCEKLTGKLALAHGSTIRNGKSGPLLLENRVVIVVEEFLEHVKAICVINGLKIKTIRIKRIDLYPIKALYPDSLFIKEPGIKLDGLSEVPDDTQTCSYYARKGSHWVKYNIESDSQAYYLNDEDNVPDHIDKNFFDIDDNAEEIDLLKAFYAGQFKKKME